MRGNMVVKRRGKSVVIKRILIVFFILVILIASFSFLVYKRYIVLNKPSLEDYPIRGIDVSSYQGDIDWKILSKQNVNFAYIKATEGSSFVDPKWKNNYDNSKDCGLKIGAYHFFSFESDASTQADNFIKNVEKDDKMLPPAIDIEFYGSKVDKSEDEIKEQLNIMCSKLEEHYGKKPVLYATYKSYNKFIKGGYEDNPIWIRSVYFKPIGLGREKYTFWQYTDRAILDGYKGPEKYIDVNIFNGTLEELNSL